MIKRTKYLNQLIALKNNGFPKVITGPRRTGKSYLLHEIFTDYLIENNVPEENIILIELDDDKNAHLRNPIELGKYVRSITKDKSDCYVILDEIQRVFTIVNPALTGGKIKLAKAKDTETISFVDVVLGLSHEKNIDLYITGSNSKMLSTDIVTEFRDKASQIRMHPLSFEEFYSYRQGSKTDALYEYMQYGGMPLAVLSDENSKKQYLKGLFETTYFKDIIEHHNLKKTETLDELCTILSDLTGELLNSKKLSNTFKSVKHENIDAQTIEKYIQYFKDAFILQEANRYDIRGKKEIGALRKYYFVDTGLRNARLNFAYPDEGQLLENIVYNELIYNGYTINVGTFDTVEKNKEGKSVRKTNEIDFFAQKNERKYYIQISTDISNSETRNREIRPFIKLNDQIQKILVVNRPYKAMMDEEGFITIGASEFLLNFIK